MTAERIQKLLSHAGYGSRRQIEQWIADGQVRVNGQLASAGQKITIDDQVQLHGQRLHLKKRSQVAPQVIAYYKPVGEVSTRNDEQDRPTVFTALPDLANGRWVQIGRLDINTDGLLLFTTDGELANRLMHPRYEIERVYAVRVYGDVQQADLDEMLKGIELEDGEAHFKQVKFAGGEGMNKWYHVALHEGRNREVRRMWEHFGYTVSRLTRISYAGIDLDRKIKRGTSASLSVKQLRKLYEVAGMTYQEADHPAAQPRKKLASKSVGPKGRPKQKNSRSSKAGAKPTRRRSSDAKRRTDR